MARPKRLRGEVRPTSFYFTEHEYTSIGEMARQLTQQNNSSVVRIALGMMRLSGIVSGELKPTKALMATNFFESLPEPIKSFYSALEYSQLEKYREDRKAKKSGATA